MSSILGIVQQQQQTSIDEDKLQVLCVEKMSGIILDWTGKIFKIFRKQNNSNLFENFILKTCLAAQKQNIHLSIGSATQNPTGLNMTKITESGNDRTEMTLSISTEEKPVKCINMWKNHGFFSLILAILALKKLTCLGILSTI